MPLESVFVRCNKCGAVNRIPSERITENPKCGKCKNYLDIPRTPVNATSASFNKEVLEWPGGVLVEFWAPW